jgi:hypothetical protein
MFGRSSGQFILWRVLGNRWFRAGAVVALSLFIALSVSQAHAARETDPFVSKFVGKNWVNGRSWEKLEYAGKLGYVCGLFDGITLFWSMAEGGGKSVKKDALNSAYKSLGIPVELTVGDVVAGMDEFYKDAGNAPLPAVCAYMHYVYQSRGDSQESISRHLTVWRTMFKD